jgi:isocitrate dehydrogenase (NAD+)
MKFSDGVFLATALEVAREYPDVELREMQVDELAMWLAWKPQTVDVMLLPNLYGDILSDLSAGLVGGLGVAPGANLGWEYAVFEPVHGSAPDIAGTGKANPVAMILSAEMMLRHLGETEAANRIGRAVAEVLVDGTTTPDLGGSASTVDVAEAVARRVA